MQELSYFLNYWPWITTARIWYWSLAATVVVLFFIPNMAYGRYGEAFSLLFKLPFRFGILAVVLESGCALGAVLHLVHENREDWLWEEDGELNITPEDFFDQGD